MPKPTSLEEFLNVAPSGEPVVKTPVEEFLEPTQTPEPEETEPEKPTDKQTEPEPQTPEAKAKPVPTIYTERIREYIEEGDWKDGTIEIEDDKGEIQAVLLSELENVDAETFKKIKAGQKAIKEEELKEKYISVEGLDDTTKKIIEAKKAGADITPLLQQDAVLINPLKGYDLTDSRVQEQLIRWELHNKGEEPDDIEYKVAKYKKNFTLDTEAEKIATKINKDFDQKVKETLEEQTKANEEAAEAQKEFRKSVSEKIKAWGVNEAVAKRITDNAAKFDQTGLTAADRAYFEAKKNPELYAEIVFHLTDQKGFNEFKGVKIKNREAQNTILKINMVPHKTSTTPAKKEENTQDPLAKFFITTATTT